ncbi:MAG: hypothetical protein HGA19_01790 [Oscillochloris sp.]|nr:hypothetical protein [Oscillochloris sp.]
MADSTASFDSIDTYIAMFPPEIQVLLESVRSTIRAAAPAASEKISYQMPTFFLDGNLVHFAAFKHHIGLYPAPSGVAAFQAELAPYTYAKGSVRFLFGQPLPLDLIQRIVEFRVAENRAKAAKRPGSR